MNIGFDEPQTVQSSCVSFAVRVDDDAIGTATNALTPNRTFRLTVMEGLLLVLPVGVLAMALGWGALTLIAATMGAIFPAGLHIGAYSVALGLALMLAISLGSVLPPVIRALRLDIVALLRTT